MSCREQIVQGASCLTFCEDLCFILSGLLLHVEIVLKAKQPEAEMSLVYDIFIRVIKKESASRTRTRAKRERNKHVKHVKCKEVLWFICEGMKQG